MSSTNRGGQRSASDYYITPIEEIVKFLCEFEKDEPNVVKGADLIFDPCAGGDIDNDMSYPVALRQYSDEVGYILTMDIRGDSRAELKGDYLSLTMIDYQRPDVITTNPPFALAREIITKALQDVVSGGWVIMLLRLNYFGSDTRKVFWEENMPKYAYVHRRRISFREDGKTDSIEYMHAVWHQGEKNRFTMLRVI